MLGELLAVRGLGNWVAIGIAPQIMQQSGTQYEAGKCQFRRPKPYSGLRGPITQQHFDRTRADHSEAPSRLRHPVRLHSNAFSRSIAATFSGVCISSLRGNSPREEGCTDSSMLRSASFVRGSTFIVAQQEA